MSDQPPDRDNANPAGLHSAWRGLLIPIVVFVAAYAGEMAHIGEGRLVLFCLVGAGTGSIFSILGFFDTKSRRPWETGPVSVLALLLNLALALGVLFIYAMAHAWDGVKG
jgi:hypothetical protein